LYVSALLVNILREYHNGLHYKHRMDPTYMFQLLHSCGYLQEGALQMYYKSLKWFRVL